MKIFVFTISLFFIVISRLFAEENPYGYYPDDFVIVDSVPDSDSYNCLECFNNRICISGMTNGFNYFRISEDGGKTWKKLKLTDELETKIEFKDIEFIDSGWFLAAGTDGYIIHVHDNLSKVEIVNIKEITNRISEIDIRDDGYGMCKGNGKLFYTEDFGKTWNKFDINPADYGLESVFGFELTDNYIYVQLSKSVFNDGFYDRTLKLLRSPYKNINWTVYDLPEFASDFQFVNDSSGWACGSTRSEIDGVYGKNVYKISKYGEKTDLILEATYLETFSSGIRGMNFKNEHEGYFYGDSGILYTFDGGHSWIDVYESDEGWPPNWHVNGVETFPENKMIFVEKNYLFANLNTTTVEIENSNSTISLHPNPATDHIIIDTELLSGTIEIYNLLGIKVAEQAITSGREKIDVSSLPAGMYFLKAGDQVRKFVKQ